MSERVLHEWRFAGYVCRIVESEPGIVISLGTNGMRLRGVPWSTVE